MKKVLIISTSFRKDGNSETLAKEFERGVVDAGHETEFVSLAGKTLHFCIGCFACEKTEKCFRDDDASAIVEKMRRADVVVFATPVYSNQMCGQMKTLLDRTNPIYAATYDFREVYLLTTAAVDEEHVPDGVVEGLQGWIRCFDKAELKGVIRGVGVGARGEVQERADLLAMTYEMGKSV